ncbi:MAG: polysaccharide biosynthesis/export family protein [Alphaproteobacteria bacterium]
MSDGKDLDLSALKLDTLMPYGANLFRPGTEPESATGVTPDYEIAIGDRIEIWLWGAVEAQLTTPVDGQGNIFLPKIGPVRVAGLKYRDLNPKVVEAVRTVYTSNVNVYTNLPQAQAIGVFVTGFVQAPGRHLGRSIDSIIHYLRRAGGIDPVRGSYRYIYVRRDNKIVQTVDLYPFLTAGVLPKFQFMEGDTIVVAPRGPVARVGGAVQNPAVFELGARGLPGRQIVAWAGPESAVSHVYVRMTRTGRTSQIYVPLANFLASSVAPDDEVVFFKDAVRPSVTVSVDGAVVGQSVYSATRGARLSQVLNFVRVDPKLADLDSIYIRRKSVAEQQRRLLDENLRRVQEELFKAEKLSRGEIEIRVREADLLKRVVETLQNVKASGIVVLHKNGVRQDIILEHEDVIVIPPRNDIVSVAGEVVAPQTFRYDPSRTVSEYIRLTGGVTELGRADKFLIYHRNGEVSIGGVQTVRPGDQIMLLPYIRTNLLQVAIDVAEVVSRALVLGRLAGAF